MDGQQTGPTESSLAPPPARPEEPLLAQESSWRHVITSSVIAVAWMPFCLVVLIAARYCPQVGRETYVTVLALGFIGLQLGGNVLVGAVLDRRYGRAGGVASAIGRCLLAAVVLLVVGGLAWWGLAAFGPEGMPQDC